MLRMKASDPPLSPFALSCVVKAGHKVGTLLSTVYVALQLVSLCSDSQACKLPWRCLLLAVAVVGLGQLLTSI